MLSTDWTSVFKVNLFDTTDWTWLIIFYQIKNSFSICVFWYIDVNSYLYFFKYL